MQDDGKLYVLKRDPIVPLDTAAALRALADQVESGVCTGVTWAAIVNEEYEVRSGSSIKDTLVLATLLQDWSVRRYRSEA